MSTNGIEVPEQHGIPVLQDILSVTNLPHRVKSVKRAVSYLLCRALVPDNFLYEVFGLAIGVCAATHRMLLINGEFLGVSIDSGRAAEYEITHSMRLHHLIQTHTEPQPVRHALSTNMHTQTPNCTESVRISSKIHMATPCIQILHNDNPCKYMQRFRHFLPPAD